MPGEPIHPTTNTTATDMEKHKQLDREIRDMIATLTKRLAELQHIHKSGSASSHGHAHGDSSHPQHHHDDELHGVRITLAGSNQGATMHGEAMDDKSTIPEDADPYEALGTYVNSNFQAINNSIMLGGSYTANDPGVHMDISDVIDHPHGLNHKQDADEKKGKKMKKLKEKEKEKEKEEEKEEEEKENDKSEQHHSDKSD